MHRRLALLAVAGLGCIWMSSGLAAEALPETPGAQAEAKRLAAAPPVRPPPGRQIRIDTSGRREVGKASVYSHRFERRRMADGARYHATAPVVASRSLPLGTTARVTNLKTGESTVVEVQDRGPFVDGRVADLSPAAAQRIGLDNRQGVVPVEVAPIVVPQPDGTAKAGAGAAQ